MYKLTGVMFSQEEIASKVEELARQIEEDYKGQDLLLVGILKGASVFVADLMRKINLNVNIDFMSVSSYGSGTESSGTVKILKDLDVDIKDKNVLIVEDIRMVLIMYCADKQLVRILLNIRTSFFFL